MFKRFLIGTLAVVAFVVTANLALASYDFGSATLKVGSRGQYVTTLQNLVGATPIDGFFGPKTKAKVVAWQMAHDLIADGFFGPVSKAKANETGTNFSASCTNASGFSTTTGLPCSSLNANTFPAGCTNASGFSTTTGLPCSSLNANTFSAGCTNASGFSTTTGYSCVTGFPRVISGGGSSGHHRDTVISTTAITGVTAPVTGATPVTIVTAGTGYTGTVTWSGTPSTFASTTSYTATITLTATSGYTLTGVTANQFTIAGSTSDTNSSNSGVITAVFPVTAATVITATAIAGVTAPVTGATPVTIVTAGTGYTGTVTWSGTPSTFASATSYTATITLTATSGYTLTGVTADQFTIAGSTSDTNSSNSGVITAVFPATAVTGMAFVLTTPAPGTGNSLTGGGATTAVNVDVVSNTSSVVITGTKTAGQTVVIKGFAGDLGGLDSMNVTTGGTATTPIYTVNMTTPGADVHTSGGTKWFTIVVSEAGKSDITYDVHILVGNPTFNPVTSPGFTTAAANTMVTITLTSGTFKTGTIAASDFTFGGPNAVALAAGTFTRSSTIIVTITNLTLIAGTGNNTVLVKGATQATQAASVAAVASTQ